ncbi:MAG: HNH endonuclease, partial [Geodermatophilaceae bacterium]|nr:HNH endonuclease [Geodermatophilaceae bacterium]
PAQRTAPAVRDKHCQAPGCDRPPQWCDAHHLKPWYHGGRTDLNNLILLCRRPPRRPPTHLANTRIGRWLLPLLTHRPGSSRRIRATAPRRLTARIKSGDRSVGVSDCPRGAPSRDSARLAA